MKRKGFTLVELLVVIAIIALLMGILMPALARVRMIAYRMVCGTNLAGIGKAILLYAGDAEEEYPLSGCNRSTTFSDAGLIPYWYRQDVPASDCTAGPYFTGAAPYKMTIGSIFYLLVKYEDVSVKQFNCKGDVGVRPFKLTDWTEATTLNIEDMTQIWDFGGKPGIYNSYSYNQPFGIPPGISGLRLSVNLFPTDIIAADRNPGMDENAIGYLLGGATAGGTAQEKDAQTPLQLWDNMTSKPHYVDEDLVYNAFPHQREGQNVLFNDIHVEFAKTTNVGVDNDNIYQRWPYSPDPPPSLAAVKKSDYNKRAREVGGYFPQMPTTGTKSYTGSYPGRYHADDALLISERHDSGRAL